ncbi:MAG: PAS domain S-box protein [Isosphaeraceae bacterium]
MQQSGRWTVLAYVAAATAWIVVSDRLLAWSGLPELWVERLASVKGLGFVAVTALVLDRMIARLFRTIEASRRELAASEERFRRALIESPMPAILHAEDGSILLISDSWFELTGYDREELKTVGDWTERAYGHRKDSVRARIDQLFELDRRFHEGDFEVRVRDGSMRVWEFSTAPMGRLPDGRRSILSMALDVTERRWAEAALKESEWRFRKAVEHSPFPIMIYAEDGEVVSLSRSWSEITGYSPQEISTIEAWTERAYGEDRLAVREEIERVFELTERSPAGDYSVRCKDASQRIWEFSSVGLGRLSDGRRIAISMASDVTERRAAERELRSSERRFRTLVEAAPIGIFLQSRGTFAYLNPAAMRLFGRPDPRDLLGSTVASHFHPDDRRVLLERIRTLNELRRPVETIEERALGPGGEAIACEVMAVPMQVGEDHGALVFLWDITARKAAERALGESAERLRELTRRLLEIQETERRVLARELHDEIGQALTAVKIDLQAIQRERDDAGGRLEDAAALVVRTLQQVRGMALDLRPSLLDDLGLCAALGWYVKRFSERTGVQGDFRSEPEEVPVEPDVATACFRVCQEALTNVARHSRARHCGVELRQEPGRIVLLIRDDGVGFAPREALARATAGGSMGLLGIRERVELAGGSARFDSTPGGGTEVLIHFPIHPRESTARGMP